MPCPYRCEEKAGRVVGAAGNLKALNLGGTGDGRLHGS